MNTKAVLITGGRAPVALDAARNFYLSGYEVHVAESFRSHFCKESKCVKKAHLVASPRFNELLFIEELVKIINDYNIELVLPTCEETFYISKYKTVIEDRTKATVYTDTIEKLQLLHHKQTFIEKVKELGLPFPETIAVTEVSEETSQQLKAAFGDVKVVAKPAYSRFGSQVTVLQTDDSLRHLKASVGNPLLFQRFIEGVQICVYATCLEGEITSITLYRALFTAGLGAGLHFDYVQNEKIEWTCQEIVSALSYTGQISFDFILDPSGICYPIECNPRGTSGLHLLLRDNWLKDFITPQKTKQVAIYRRNCMLIVPMLTIGLMSMRSFKQFKSYCRILTQSQDVLFNRKDMKPFFYQIVSYGAFYKIARQKRISVIEATTYDIEWNGEQ